MSSSSSSSSHSDPDGIVVIEESDIVVLDDEVGDTDTSSSFKSAADSEIVVLEEDDLLDLGDAESEHALNDGGAMRVGHSTDREEQEGDISNSFPCDERSRPIDGVGTAEAGESHGNNTPLTNDPKNVEAEEVLAGASEPRATQGSRQSSCSSSSRPEWCSCPQKYSRGLPRSRHPSYLLRTPRSYAREESPVTPVSEDPDEMAALRNEFIRQAGECQGCRSHNTAYGDLLSRDPRAFGIEIIPSAFVETPYVQFVLKETDKPDDPVEIVEIVDDRGYSHLIRGPFLVPRRYYFGLITIQEPFDPQLDLDWCREAFVFMAVYEAESILSADVEKESPIWKAVNALKTLWKDIWSPGDRDPHVVVLTSWPT